MLIQKSIAEGKLGISYTTFYNWAAKLGIKLVTKIDSKGKSSYIEMEDLKRMADAMWKPLELDADASAREDALKGEWQGNNTEVVQAQMQEIKQENFALQLKVQQQEESLKANNEVISLYKEQTQQLQNQQQNAQWQINIMYVQLIKSSNRATAFLIACIALWVILVLFIGLVVWGKLRF